MRVRIGRALTFGVAVVLGAVVSVPSPAGASCVGPALSVDRTSVAIGGVLEVRGQWFGTDCNDTGRRGPVLGDPRRGIEIQMTQDGVTVPLARVDANLDYEFVVRVMVPPTLEAGPATVAAATAVPVVVDVQLMEPAAPVSQISPPTILVGGHVAGPGGARDNWAPWLVGGVVVAAAIAAVVLLTGPRRRPHERVGA